MIKLNKFVPRPYQLPPIDAILNKGYKRVLVIMPRRAGKDVMAFNILISSAIKRVGVYYYVFPTYSQAKKVIWSSVTNTGERFLDYVPRELVLATNSQEMIIKFSNGSIIQLVGSDNVDSLMGTNPRGIIFSEYSLQDPRAYAFLRPILLANDGFALFISTPRGRNHLWEMYNIAKESSDWFVYKLSITDTNHIPLAEIEKEKAEGLMSEDLIQQEYFCSFDQGVEGSFYGKYIDRMRRDGRIGIVPYEPGFQVHSAWDLGVSDSNVIIFFQVCGHTVNIIDYYENSKQGLEHYAKIISEKDYNYGRHIAPHDINVKEWGSGMTRIEKAKRLGINFVTAPNISITDGIETVRSTLPKVWIDEQNCKKLIFALENYRQEYDAKRKVYRDNPLHDWSSHAADAMRYLCLALPKTQDGMSAQDLSKRYRETLYGDQGNMPAVFRDDLPKY